LGKVDPAAATESQTPSQCYDWKLRAGGAVGRLDIRMGHDKAKGVKPRLVIPPLLATAAVAVWIGVQRQSMGVVERESGALRAAIAAAQEASGSGGEELAGPAGSRAAAARRKQPIQWRDLAERLEEGEGVQNMRMTMRLQQRLLDLDAAELASALDEIAGLDLSVGSQQTLESMLMGLYLEKAPEEALNRFADRLVEGDGGMIWQLSHGLGTWAQKDPFAAAAWLDRQIEAGVFESKALDGRSPGRVRFESALLTKLLEGDSVAAEHRVAALTPDQRREVFQHIAVNEVDARRFSDLVRNQAGSDEAAAKAFAHAGSRLAHLGYERVDRFLEEGALSPTERAAVVEQAAASRFGGEGPVDRAEIDAMRQWADRQAPGTADKATGRALAASSRGDSFAANAAIALEYRSDAVLGTFIEESRHFHRDEARAMLEHVSDPALRERLAGQLK
jgi:hypothetical protein